MICWRKGALGEKFSFFFQGEGGGEKRWSPTPSGGHVSNEQTTILALCTYQISFAKLFIPLNLKGMFVLQLR